MDISRLYVIVVILFLSGDSKVGSQTISARLWQCPFYRGPTYLQRSLLSQRLTKNMVCKHGWVTTVQVVMQWLKHDAECEITEFTGFWDTKKHFQKPIFLTRVSNWTSWKIQSFWKPKDYSSIRKAWKSFGNQIFRGGFPKGNRIIQQIIFRNFVPWWWLPYKTYGDRSNIAKKNMILGHLLGVWPIIIYIQSRFPSRSPDIVYGPIFTRFGEYVGLWTKGAEKYQNFGYLDNRCHGNQKTSPELTKHLKGYGILSGGALGRTRIVAMDSCYHSNHCVAMVTKKCLETHGTLLISSVATPLTRPSERVEALVILYASRHNIYKHVTIFRKELRKCTSLSANPADVCFTEKEKLAKLRRIGVGKNTWDLRKILGVGNVWKCLGLVKYRIHASLEYWCL